MFWNILLWAIGLVALTAILSVVVVNILNTIEFIREWRDDDNDWSVK